MTKDERDISNKLAMEYRLKKDGINDGFVADYIYKNLGEEAYCGGCGKLTCKKNISICWDAPYTLTCNECMT